MGWMDEWFVGWHGLAWEALEGAAGSVDTNNLSASVQATENRGGVKALGRIRG